MEWKGGPSLALTSEKAEDSSEGILPIKPSVVRDPQEVFGEITTSSDTHCGETKVEEIPGKSPQVHACEDVCGSGCYCIWSATHI